VLRKEASISSVLKDIIDWFSKNCRI
jgi:hypothetical protein